VKENVKENAKNARVRELLLLQLAQGQVSDGLILTQAGPPSFPLSLFRFGQADARSLAESGRAARFISSVMITASAICFMDLRVCRLCCCSAR